jgi:hypothetical protein
MIAAIASIEIAIPDEALKAARSDYASRNDSIKCVVILSSAALD